VSLKYPPSPLSSLVKQEKRSLEGAASVCEPSQSPPSIALIQRLSSLPKLSLSFLSLTFPHSGFNHKP